MHDTSLRLVEVPARALDGVEVERGELLPGAVLQRALDLLPGDDGPDAGRRPGEDEVSLLCGGSVSYPFVEGAALPRAS